MMRLQPVITYLLTTLLILGCWGGTGAFQKYGPGCNSQREKLGIATIPTKWTLQDMGKFTLGDLTVTTNLSDALPAAANLLCASGLPGCQNPSLEDSLRTIRDWARRVRTETDRHLYRFRRAPAEFENSEGFFRMLMLTVVLQEDFGVHYDESRKGASPSASPQDGFFSQPQLVFLQGLLGPKRAGTCSSMPVLYLAIGRELG